MTTWGLITLWLDEQSVTVLSVVHDIGQSNSKDVNLSILVLDFK